MRKNSIQRVARGAFLHRRRRRGSLHGRQQVFVWICSTRQCQDLYLPSAQIVPVIPGWFCGMDHESPVPPAPIWRGKRPWFPAAMIEDLRHLPGSCFDVYVIRIVSEPQNESLTCQIEDLRVWRPRPVRPHVRSWRSRHRIPDGPLVNRLTLA